jgi:hypothetical protein
MERDGIHDPSTPCSFHKAKSAGASFPGRMNDDDFVSNGLANPV